MVKKKSEAKNSKKIWFRARRYGWGWTPNTWEGWLLTLGFMAIAISGAMFATDHPGTPFATIFFPFLVLFTVIFIFTCYATGEKPEWRWGGKPIFKK